MSAPLVDNVSVTGVLCTQCGACGIICPVEHCITFSSDKLGNCYPLVNEKKCVHCGLCLQVCPAFDVELDELYAQVFGEPPVDPTMGYYISSWVGHATDPTIRYSATSGGTVTAFLQCALEQMVDGALVVRLDGLTPTPFIARTAKDVLRAMGAKYLPVTPLTALVEVLQSPEGQRVGVVGLPCQIAGLRKLCLADHRLAQQVAFTIGLFCGHTKDRRYTDFVLRRMRGPRHHRVAGIQYRGSGWPGEIQMTTEAGCVYRLPQQSHSVQLMWQVKAYAPPRCLVCKDHLAYFADLAVGDAWLPEYVGSDNQGTSIVLSRTTQGESLLDAARSAGAVYLEPLPCTKVLQSQPNVSDDMRRGSWGGLAVRLARAYPEFQRVVQRYELELAWKDKVLAWYRLVIWRFFSSRLFLSVADQLPEAAFRVFGVLQRRLHKLSRQLSGSGSGGGVS